jgi:hypothetical protein
MYPPENSTVNEWNTTGPAETISPVIDPQPNPPAETALPILRLTNSNNPIS